MAAPLLSSQHKAPAGSIGGLTGAIGKLTGTSM